MTTPWVYMGMMFSTFCWHVEDLWLNSLNYSHTGAIKTWYVVPSSHKDKFDCYVENKTGRSDLLNRITFMIDPLELLAQGIPVHRADQQPGEYICTFYKAYHAGFSHGFNVGEAVNFVSPLSLNYIKSAINADSVKGMSILSYEWLVYQNKLSPDSCQQLNPIVCQEYDSMIKKEFREIVKVSKKFSLQLGEPIASSAKYDRNSCSKCRNYLYLSSIKCSSCGKNYCFQDLFDCCHSHFQLILREPNPDRNPILSLFNRK